MKKIIFTLIIMFLFPLSVLALSDSYTDLIADITKEKIVEDKINIYFFHRNECSHCARERVWLKDIKKEYKDYIVVYMYEVNDSKNSILMEDVGKRFDIKQVSTPLTIIGDEYYSGFSETTASIMENKIKEYIQVEDSSNEVKIPILGKVNMKSVSIPLVAVILGFIDGFNPCAMWILLFLINLLFGIKDKKKAWILGYTFLFVSGFVYFLSMIGINFVLNIATVNWIKKGIAIFILMAGILNFRKYFKIRNEEAGCTVVDNKKRKRLITRMKKIISSRSFLLALLGIIVLATSVNLVELACSLGFPVIFTELLSINSVTGIMRIIYLLVYILFYMIDDLFVFTISMITVEATGITNKYNKICTLISAIIMILMGLLLIFKPEWLMFNF